MKTAVNSRIEKNIAFSRESCYNNKRQEDVSALKYCFSWSDGKGVTSAWIEKIIFLRVRTQTKKPGFSPRLFCFRFLYFSNLTTVA